MSSKIHLLTAVAVVSIFFLQLAQANGKRQFAIDYANNAFTKDGEPFKYVSGSLHYMQSLAANWKDRLHKMRLAGLNAISTYVEWRLHEKTPGVFDFTGDNDIIKFIKTAEEEDLLVILRLGPYIDGEREMGGFPSWLLKENPQMKLRTNDPTYMKFATRWLTELLTQITPLLYGNGGPVILLQVENEYGSFYACDFGYMNAVRDLIYSFAKDAAVLFTTDGDADYFLKCGKIKGAYATVDFGPGENASSSFAAQREKEPQGPLVNSEFYPGWMDHWGSSHSRGDTPLILKTLADMFQMNASVNIYMFHGGTNFGFSAGSNIYEKLYPTTTSYDFDAPLTEAGDPTDKYFAIQKAVMKYLNRKAVGPNPEPAPKGNYGQMKMKYLGSLFELAPSKIPQKSQFPLSFEQLDQSTGFVLYKTMITVCLPDPALLVADQLSDRGYVFVNKKFSGILSRSEEIFSMPISAAVGDEISILVENQGRNAYGTLINDSKGLLKNVTINNQTVEYWTMLNYEFENYGKELSEINQKIDLSASDLETPFKVLQQPYIFWTDFSVPSGPEGIPLDTFLDPQGWFKGVAFINGFNLGRYWPRVGPQRTLYLPGCLLKTTALNRLIFIEFDRAPESCFEMDNKNCSVLFRTDPILDQLCV